MAYIWLLAAYDPILPTGMTKLSGAESFGLDPRGTRPVFRA